MNDIEQHYIRTFSTPSGRAVLAHLRKMTIERYLGPNASDAELLHMIINHPELFDRLIQWEQEDNIFHRRLTRRETPSEIKTRLLAANRMGISIS